ncbi:MAG: protein kinase, partial [Candidatus Eremiobacteraeota bacterium]|nr:protein kinase [Candidatus Eremiobacteraeota bacterium]
MAEEWHDTLTAADLSLEVSRLHSMSRSIPDIPGYDLRDVLGTGAFGQVYRGTQKSTGQTVAVKVLFTVNEGLREEVRRLSQVADHPNIVTLVDANLDHDPPYLVTPYLPGSLQERVPASPNEANIMLVTQWFESSARALQFVHARGMLHCDLKPANILLGEDEQPRLVDFG